MGVSTAPRSVLPTREILISSVIRKPCKIRIGRGFYRGSNPVRRISVKRDRRYRIGRYK